MHGVAVHRRCVERRRRITSGRVLGQHETVGGVERHADGSERVDLAEDPAGCRVGVDRDGAFPWIVRFDRRGSSPSRPIESRRQRRVQLRELARQCRPHAAAGVSSASTSESPASTPSSTRRATSSGDDLGTSSPAVMSVSMKPTWTATTCVCWPSSSRRSELVSDHDAAFAAQYSALCGAPNHDSTDNTLTIAPPPLAPSTGANARLIANGPSTLVSNSRCAMRHRVVRQHRRARADPGVVDQQRDVTARTHRRLDVGLRGDVELDRFDAADPHRRHVTRPGVHLGRTTLEQRRAQRRPEASVASGDQRNRSCNIHDVLRPRAEPCRARP